MKTYQANLLNSIVLIVLGLWGYFEVVSPTALIPVFFGIVLLLCNVGVKKENKVIAHIVVLLTLLLLMVVLMSLTYRNRSLQFCRTSSYGE